MISSQIFSKLLSKKLVIAIQRFIWNRGYREKKQLLFQPEDPRGSSSHMWLILHSDSIAKAALHITGDLWGPSNLILVEVGEMWITSLTDDAQCRCPSAQNKKLDRFFFPLRSAWWIAGKSAERNCGDPRAAAGSTAELPGEFLHLAVYLHPAPVNGP